MRKLLDSQINVLLNAEAEAASVAEVSPEQLVLLHLQTTFQKLHGLVTSHRYIAGDLLVSSNPKGTHSVPCCNGQSINSSKPRNQRFNNCKIRTMIIPLEKTGVWPLSCSST